GLVGETLLLCPSEDAVVVDPDGEARPATCADERAPDDPGRLLPVGGNGLLLLNLDYRFPIVGAFGGTVFFDAGNVWANWRDIDPAEAKLGIGAGVRYRSPVGPVRAEVAWKLDREPQEDPYEVFLSFGYAF
ncbi:MAG: BamA/TamA family outer membrane protein, partial [Thermoanaerobaculia bacterium]